jgi:hypothetical protein
VSPISVGVATDPEDRINASRSLIPLTWFDGEKCATGLDRLRSYRKRWNRSLNAYAGPLHDSASHGADSFGEFAVNRRSNIALAAPTAPPPVSGDFGWMA